VGEPPLHRGSGSYRSDNPFFLINRAIALRGTELYDQVVDQLPPADFRDSPEPAVEVLRESRRDYRVPDPRVEALWEVWSGIGGEVGDRKENRLPFLAQALADAIRRRRGSGRDGSGTHPRELLGRLRRWRATLRRAVVALSFEGGTAPVRIDRASRRAAMLVVARTSTATVSLDLRCNRLRSGDQRIPGREGRPELAAIRNFLDAAVGAGGTVVDPLDALRLQEVIADAYRLAAPLPSIDAATSA
jgi:hypothetical protein